MSPAITLGNNLLKIMIINGRDVDIHDLSISQVAVLLREASPSKNGRGIEARFTLKEIVHIKLASLSEDVGKTIHRALIDAVKDKGFNAMGLTYTMSDGYDFRTTGFM